MLPEANRMSNDLRTPNFIRHYTVVVEKIKPYLLQVLTSLSIPIRIKPVNIFLFILAITILHDRLGLFLGFKIWAIIEVFCTGIRGEFLCRREWYYFFHGKNWNTNKRQGNRRNYDATNFHI